MIEVIMGCVEIKIWNLNARSAIINGRAE